MFTLDNSKTCSIHNKGDSENLDIKWMEHQASKLAPLILMPLKTFKQKYNEIKKQIKEKIRIKDQMVRNLIKLTTYIGLP